MPLAVLQTNPKKIECLPGCLAVHAANNYDPTHTTTLRNLFARNMNRRFTRLRGIIRKAIVEEDCFALMRGSRGFLAMKALDLKLEEMVTPGPYAFDFPRSADKVTAFMDWLKRQEQAGILQTARMPQLGIAVEDAWTNMYIKDSYQRGVLRARYELRGAGYDVPSIDQTGGIGAAMFQPPHVERLGLLYTRAFSDLKGITDTMDMQISRVLSQAMADGKNPREIARLLTRTISGPVGDLGITDTLGRFIPAQRRAMLLARTEVIRSHHQSMIQEYRNWGVEGVKVKAEWKTAGDGRVCDECASLEGETYTLDEIMNMIPLHPQCVIGNTRISPVDITAASERWFDGEIVIIGTAEGKKLSCTPNHPILTDRGWIPSGSLNIGDNVACGFSGNWDMAKCRDNQNIPATIKEITESFRRFPEMFASKMPTSSPDFHGDGMDGNIAIVWANSKLGNKIYPSFFQKITQNKLILGDILRLYLQFSCSFYFSLKRHFMAFYSFIRRFGLSFSLCVRHLIPFNSFCLGLCSGSYPVFFKHSINNISGDIKFKRKFICGHALIKKITNFFFRENVSGRISGSKAVFNDNALDDFVSHIKIFGNTANSFAGNIPLDNIVSIRRELFHGYVYNLQTPKEYYIAEGIAIHNCRCLALPLDVTEGEKKESTLPKIDKELEEEITSEEQEFNEYKKELSKKYSSETMWKDMTDDEIDTYERLEREFYNKKKELEALVKTGQETGEKLEYTYCPEQITPIGSKLPKFDNMDDYIDFAYSDKLPEDVWLHGSFRDNLNLSKNFKHKMGEGYSSNYLFTTKNGTVAESYANTKQGFFMIAEKKDINTFNTGDENAVKRIAHGLVKSKTIDDDNYTPDKLVEMVVRDLSVNDVVDNSIYDDVKVVNYINKIGYDAIETDSEKIFINPWKTLKVLRRPELKIK